MSCVNAPRDVRVTAKSSIKSPFVAPELSPVRTVDAELEKGSVGWTDFDVKVPSLKDSHAERVAKARLAQYNVGPKGSIIRKPRPKTVRVFSAGPSADFKARQAAAAALRKERSK